MSEKQKSINNPMLMGALELLRAENTADHRNMVMQEVLHAQFLSPVVVDPPLVPDENGVARMTAENKINLLMLTAADEKRYFMAYTDMEELKKYNTNVEYQIFGFRFSDYVKMLLNPSGDPSNNGIIVNPYDHKLVITKAMIQDMLQRGNYFDQ